LAKFDAPAVCVSESLGCVVFPTRTRLLNLATV
jgi:hypothetical protein